MTEPIKITTIIDEVTLFYEAALITRVGTIPVNQTDREIRVCLSDLPLALYDHSLRTSLGKPSNWVVRNVSIEIGQRVQAEKARLEDKLEELSEQMKALQSEAGGVSAQIAEVTSWLNQPLPERIEEENEKKIIPPIFPYASWQEFTRVCQEKLKRLFEKEKALNWQLFETEKALALQRSIAKNDGKSRKSDPSTRYGKNLLVTLTQAGKSNTAPESITISYIVPGAQWIPAYKLYIEENYQKARLALFAQVAHRSGEDWENVKLKFSSARIERQIQLPELPSKRIGKIQPPKPASFKKKLPSAEALYEGFLKWERTLGLLAETEPASINRLFSLCQEKLEAVKRTKVQTGVPSKAISAYASRDKPWQGIVDSKPRDWVEAEKPPLPPLPPPSPPCEAAPMIQPSPDFLEAARRPEKKAKRREKGDEVCMAIPAEAYSAPRLAAAKGAATLSAGFSGEMAKEAAVAGLMTDSAWAGISMDECEARPEEPALSENWRQVANYFNYTLTGVETTTVQFRGQLRKQREIGLAENVTDPESNVFAALAAAKQAATANLFSKEDFSNYQCIYEARGRASVPADGQPHLVNIMAAVASSLLSYRTIPMTDPQVFGRLVVQNPFELPLPKGKVEVFVDNAYVFSTPFQGIAVNGNAIFPMGVEQRLKVARNTHFTQEEKGIISGTTHANHHIEIEIKSLMTKPVIVEVMERIPNLSPAEKDIKLEVQQILPKGEPREFIDSERVRGTYAWEISITPGKSETIQLHFQITIPAKMEIIGGNRRG